MANALFTQVEKALPRKENLVRILEASPGIEPGCKDLQSSA